MTAFAAPTRPGHRSASPLVPWRQMGWVIWRQNRATLAVVVALLGAASVYLYISGERLRRSTGDVPISSLHGCGRQRWAHRCLTCAFAIAPNFPCFAHI